MDCCLSFVEQIGQYPSVFSQKAMYISDKIIRIAVLSVIKIIPALVGTEFFIGATPQGVTTIETFLFHSTKVFIKI